MVRDFDCVKASVAKEEVRIPISEIINLNK